jgi:hypothetical protein
MATPINEEMNGRYASWAEISYKKKGDAKVVIKKAEIYEQLGRLWEKGHTGSRLCSAVNEYLITGGYDCWGADSTDEVALGASNPCKCTFAPSKTLVINSACGVHGTQVADEWGSP